MKQDLKAIGFEDCKTPLLTESSFSYTAHVTKSEHES